MYTPMLSGSSHIFIFFSLLTPVNQMSRLGARRARDAPIQVVDVRAADQMSQAQHVRNAMAGSSSQPKPVDLASINVRNFNHSRIYFSSTCFCFLSHQT